MKRIIIIFTLTFFYSCSSEKPKDEIVSVYARIIDEQLNMDLQNILMEDDTILTELNDLMNEAIIALVEKSGGYDLNGKLINGEEIGLAKNLLMDINFYSRLNKQMDKLSIYPNKYEYLKSGLYFLTVGINRDKFQDLTLSDVFIQMTIAHNRIITASLIKENTAANNGEHPQPL